QLKREFYALQQRYNQLSFEMARNEQKMKYTDNTTLVAKVMVLEQQLEEANRALEEKTEQPRPLTVGSYVRIVKHRAQRYRHCIGQILQEFGTDRFKVRLSGQRVAIICQEEQLELVNVFLPPADEYLTREEVAEEIEAVSSEKQLEIEQLQDSLKKAKVAIARYKDPGQNPMMLRWQEKIAQMNAKLYDAQKELTQLKQENQELKAQLEGESSRVGEMQGTRTDAT
ncbi:hypothetical protein, partial [Phormidium sp. CCY1219]|uniref:hypothetical protein n=1 Tax=Phormidium sp. CCY1219 TaxID=2886104 RepID=UPI002D1F5E94